jgi:hypothetical protein
MLRRIFSFFHHTTLIVAATVLGLGMFWVILASIPSGVRNEALVSVSQSTPLYKQRVRFWIHGDGIRPRIVHAKPGLVIVTCENKTVLNAELVIERLLPNRALQTLGGVVVSAEGGRRTQEFPLTEGEYVVYERSRPEFKATIVVSP